MQLKVLKKITSSLIKSTASGNQIPDRKLVKAVNRLSKSQLSLFNALAASGGALTGGGFSVAIPTFIGVYSLACTAAAINQLQEIPQDRLMNRTRLKRPLCTEVLTPDFAKVFALSTAVVGTTTLFQFCGPVSALLGLTTVGLYNGVYTPLKQKTPYNTEVGAIVGALPPVIGIAGAQFIDAPCTEFSSLFAATITDPYSVSLFALLYAWQLPHFMAICFKNRNDYKTAGFEMLSKNDSDGYFCTRKAFGWSLAMASLPPLFVHQGVTTWPYLLDGGALSLAYVYVCLRWFRTHDKHTYSKKPFVYGLLLLPSLLFCMTIHSTRLQWLPVENTHLEFLTKVGIHTVPLHACMLPKLSQPKAIDLLPSAPHLPELDIEGEIQLELASLEALKFPETSI